MHVQTVLQMNIKMKMRIDIETRMCIQIPREVQI